MTPDEEPRWWAWTVLALLLAFDVVGAAVIEHRLESLPSLPPNLPVAGGAACMGITTTSASSEVKLTVSVVDWVEPNGSVAFALFIASSVPIQITRETCHEPGYLEGEVVDFDTIPWFLCIAPSFVCEQIPITTTTTSSNASATWIEKGVIPNQ